jgi:hypothetical protein
MSRHLQALIYSALVLAICVVLLILLTGCQMPLR